MSYPEIDPTKRKRVRLIAFVAGLIGLCLCLFIAAALTRSRPEQSRAAAPTASPLIAASPTLTNPPVPTETPTPAPQPITLSGQGDQVIDLAKWPGPALLRVSGNQESQFFAIIPYAAGERGGSLINTTAPYQGLVPLDMFDGRQTDRLEIKAPGPWQIEVLPLSAARNAPIPGQISGRGDEVIALSGSPDTAQVTGNQAGAFFAVIPYSASRRHMSVVNATDPYQGAVVLPNDSRYLEIKSSGDWSIVFP